MAASIGRGGFADMVQPVDTELSEPEKLQIKAFSEWYAQYDPFRQKDLLLKAVSTVDIKGEKREELDYHCGAVHLEYIDLLAHRDILLEAVKSNAYINDNEVEQYYYHADHLGSANWITNRNGRPVQYIHYAPYGELVANQFSRDYNERYKFTGKERDAETGYDYFGARYYYGSWGHWLSVDPLSDKYPTISPYAYCMWNPVKYVDPDGKEKISFLPQSNKTDFPYEYPDDNRLHLFFHGHSSGVIQVEWNSTKYDIEPDEKGAKLLSCILVASESELWMNYLEKKSL